MRGNLTGLALVALAVPALAAPPPPAEQAAVFKAAGFAQRGAKWKTGNCVPEEASYSPGAIETYRDLNGDGRPEAVVTEHGAMCYGMTGMQFWLLSKQAGGAWKLMASETAMPEFLKARGAGGWPDISLGGPGFCFPVVRWNGRAYVNQRLEYEGKPCRRPAP